MTPIFLFSLPRSGSTWVQRILNGHPEIDTVAEPWILLPFADPLLEKGSETIANSYVLRQAVREFCEALPEGRATYFREVGDMARRLYEQVSGGDKRYFLDKTPRYHLIQEEIFQMFPDAKFIYLWRNPLANASSIVEGWGHGEWRVFRFDVDLYLGIENLAKAYAQHRDHSLSLNYEDLIADPQKGVDQICSYLEIEPSASMLENQDKKNYGGSLGAQQILTKSESAENKNKWLKTYCNPLRRAWARNYLEWIGQERLQLMGYDKDEILADLEAAPKGNRNLLKDVLRETYIRTGYRLERPLLKVKDHGRAPMGRPYILQ